MTSQEQLEILNSGVKAWNQWRNENPEIEIELAETDLRQMDLREINLAGAYLVKTAPCLSRDKRL